jgi:myo-inositol-1(or 4)-monophosphatase
MKLGVVYDPNRNECFSATDSSVTTLNRKPLLINQHIQTTELQHCLGMIDFKRLQPAIMQKLVFEPPYRSQRSYGASALDLCWIAAQRCQLYLHGKQRIWDYAAGLLILKQAGAQAETLQGENVFHNDLNPQSVLAASNNILMNKWKTYIQEII